MSAEAARLLAAPARTRRELDLALVMGSFREYMRRAWHVIEPTRSLLPSVAIDAICAALQAVADGRIKRLAISTCPGTSKSLVGAIGYPSWLLLRSAGAARAMIGSYSWDFASRDSRRCRDVVMSEWYQGLVNGAWGMRDDADRKDDWWTTTGGRRMIVSVGGKALGERCTFQLMDDVLSGADIHSASAKREAIRWINEVLPSRLEDPDRDARVIIGQRLAVDDPISDVIRQGWKYLYLPVVLSEGDTPCELTADDGTLVWRDERAIGEPLVSLLGPEAQIRLRAELGSTAFAAQYLQRPSDDTAAIIKRTWWRFYRTGPHETMRPAGCDETQPTVEIPDRFDSEVIAADLTFGSPTGDYAVVQHWGRHGSGRYLTEQWRSRAGFESSKEAIKAMARRHPNAKIKIEKAAHGGAVIETLRNEIPGVIAVKPIGKKAQRLSAVAPTVESGCCFLPLGVAWLGDFVEELAGATNHDDQSDTAAYALLDLNSGIVGDSTPIIGMAGDPLPTRSTDSPRYDFDL